MDNQYHLDRDAILRTVRKADVITLRFVTVPERLLVDFRHTEVDPPLITVVPKVDSAEERFRSLKKLRPRFRLPEKISAIWWPRYIDSLVETGVWDAIVGRIVDDGFPASEATCIGILSALKKMERLEKVNAIKGEGYQTLWPRVPR